jgi:hypothetical protein
MLVTVSISNENEKKKEKYQNTSSYVFVAEPTYIISKFSQKPHCSLLEIKVYFIKSCFIIGLCRFDIVQ